MNRIVQAFRSIIAKPVGPPLGRWNHGNHKHANIKIDYANHDHCGSCTDDNDNQPEIHKESNLPTEDEELLQHIMGYDGIPDKSTSP
jgi:hypothetical protein